MGVPFEGMPIYNNVAIPSKPGQRLQSSGDFAGALNFGNCRNPFQTRSTTSIWTGIKILRRKNMLSQSLPNQVNDFNWGTPSLLRPLYAMSQSLPNQVNDFNPNGGVLFNKKEGLSQSLPNQVNDFNNTP